jgi:hypothetical protein
MAIAAERMDVNLARPQLGGGVLALFRATEPLILLTE